MNEDERNVLKRCAAAPADDLPRLVLADWLDEHGNPDRAAFIRLQVAAARPDTDPIHRGEWLAQADALLADHADDWERAVRVLGVTEVGYHRGLPVTAALPADRLPVVADRLAATAPTITHVRLTADDPAAARAAVAGGGLARLNGVTLQSAGLGDAGAAALAVNPYATQLRHLAVRWDLVGDVGAAVLAASPHLAALERLDLFANRLTADGVRALAAGPVLRDLAGLDLGCNSIGDAGAATLAAAPPHPQLAAVGLRNCGVGAAGVRLLLGGAGLPAVAELDLADNPLGDAGARAIASAPRAARLTRLDVRNAGVRPGGLRALADSPHLADDLVIAADDFPAGRFADFRAWVRGLGGGLSGGRGR